MAMDSRMPGWLAVWALVFFSLSAHPVWADKQGGVGEGAGSSAAPLKVAVVGGLVLSTVWPRLKPLAEAATGLPIETVAAMPKEGIVPVFARGRLT